MTQRGAAGDDASGKIHMALIGRLKGKVGKAGLGIIVLLQDFELRLRRCNDLVIVITLRTGINLMRVFKYAIVL